MNTHVEIMDSIGRLSVTLLMGCVIGFERSNTAGSPLAGHQHAFLGVGHEQNESYHSCRSSSTGKW